MATVIKIKRGLNANVGTLVLSAGEPAFTTDNGKLFVGNGTTNVAINPDLFNFSVGLGNVSNVEQLPMSYLDTNVVLGTSDVKVPSQNAVKSYIDSVVSVMATEGYVDSATSDMATTAYVTNALANQTLDGGTF